MPSRLESLSPPPALNKGKRQPLFDLTLELITPMFGGGYSPREIDKDRPVNAKEVRGHLRFWWRACHAHRYPDAAAMFRDEALLFGQSAGVDSNNNVFGPGLVDVVVQLLTPRNQIQPQVCDTRNPQPNQPADRRPQLRQPFVAGDVYALFGVVGTLEDNKRSWKVAPATMVTALSFRVSIEEVGGRSRLSPDQLAELRTALGAWVHLGGIGSRTRRGLGSLSVARWCEKSATAVQAPSLDGVLEAVRAEAVVGRPWGVPALRNGYLLRPVAQNGGQGAGHLQAWREALKVLQSFRQIDHGRINYNSQSEWPETDAIRRAVTGGPWQHPARPAMPDYYPRADLGLPIVMHFIEKNGYAHSEPPDRRIEGEEGRSRMASPIITKALPADATQSVPLIVVLDAPHVWDSQAPAVKLEPGGTVVRKNPHLNGATYGGPLTVGATTYTTAREAFRAYARSQGFTEVTI